MIRPPASLKFSLNSTFAGTQPSISAGGPKSRHSRASNTELSLLSCPDPECLVALAHWIRSNPDSDAGNFAIEHPQDYEMARLSEHWFGEQISKWENDWPRLHRAGFAIRRDAFEKLRGYREFGQFGPPLLSAGFLEGGFTTSSVPNTSVVHLDGQDLYAHHFDTIDFVRGECSARESEDAVFFEKYFGLNNEWQSRFAHATETRRNGSRAYARSAFTKRRIPKRHWPALVSLFKETVASSECRIALNEAVTLLEATLLLHAPFLRSGATGGSSAPIAASSKRNRSNRPNFERAKGSRLVKSNIGRERIFIESIVARLND